MQITIFSNHVYFSREKKTPPKDSSFFLFFCFFKDFYLFQEIVRIYKEISQCLFLLDCEATSSTVCLSSLELHWSHNGSGFVSMNVKPHPTPIKKNPPKQIAALLQGLVFPNECDTCPICVFLDAL